MMPMRLTELDTIYRIFFICFHSILDFLTVVNIYIYKAYSSFKIQNYATIHETQIPKL